MADPRLVDLIRAEIAQSGPMTFARFMELALYAPDLGYYRQPHNPADRAGDFLTAPELHPIFGAAIARAVANAWAALGEPADVTVREYGAGSGALAKAILAGLTEDVPRLAASLRYEAVEINDHRRAAIPPPIQPLAPDDAPRADSRPAGVVIANEFLDAFPVHRVAGRDGGLVELFVDAGPAGFVDHPGTPSTPALARRLADEGIELANGQRAEIALGIDDWFGEVASAFERSVVIVIDYGRPATELYGPSRRAGTLLGYRGHRVIADPYASVGRQDLTAYVDFTAVETSARRHGFAADPLLTQARYLVGLGLEELLERARSDLRLSLGEYLELRSGIGRLLDPRALGAFRVLVLRR